MKMLNGIVFVLLWVIVQVDGWLIEDVLIDVLVSGTTTFNHNDAASILSQNGITISSTGGCSNKNNKQCTSLDGIKQKAIRDVITLKTVSNCPVIVTGGTEVGHAVLGGHSQGWKLDVRMNDCLKSYVLRYFRSIGGGFYCAPDGNTYFDEGNHFDIHYGKSKC